MSNEITTAFIKEYAAGIDILQQQMMSNLRGGVVSAVISSDGKFFDQISATSMSPKGARHGDTDITETEHKRRKLVTFPFRVADYIDDPDMIRTLNNPTNDYVQNFAAAAGRTTDEQIIGAFTANVATGVNGLGSVSFDTANFRIPAGGVGLNTAKLREARKILEGAENPEDNDMNQWYVVANAEARSNMLADTEYQNSDFNSIKALVDGNVNDWLGYKFLKSELLPVAANIRSIYVWRKKSMKLGVAAEGKGFIDVLPEKDHTTQVKYALDVGCIRMDEVGVVEILCDES